MFFGFFFFCSSTVKAQTGLVEIHALSPYDFEINNVSGFPVEVHIDDSINYRLLPYMSESIDKLSIKKSSVMQLKYTQSDAMMVNNDIIRKMAAYKDGDWAKTVVLEFWGSLLNGENPTLKDVAVQYMGEDTLGRKLEFDLIEQDIRVNADLLAASNGVQNRFSPNFEPVSIHSFTKSKSSVTPLVNVIWDFPFRKKQLSDFWDRSSTNMTSEIQLSVGLRPELRWGKSRIFSSLHGFAAIYRPSYGLIPAEDDFYVADVYVQAPWSNFVQLQTGDYINLNLNHISGGLFIRTLFYPKIFVDIGGGYYFHHSARLHFDPEDGEGIEIGHLPDGLEFVKQKTKNIAEVEMKKWYGMLRVGYQLSGVSRKEPVKGFYLTATVKTSYQPTVIANDVYEFYYIDYTTGTGNGDLELVPISDLPFEENSKMSLLWKFGVGLGL